jgi:pimeloyl-ACP methyl ester carboxylesterase
LGPGYRVVGWDLPGHGHSPASSGPFGIDDLAAEVIESTRPLRAELAPSARLLYAGVSLGGAVALRSTLDGLGVGPGTMPDRVAMICSGAVLGTPAAWRERAELVRRAGTPVMVGPSSRRWFAAGFADSRPETASALLWSLQEADAGSYAACCEALAEYDLRERLPQVKVPVLVVAGAEDPVVPLAQAHELAARLPEGEVAVLDGVGHLASAEAPGRLAAALRTFFDPGRHR